MLRVASTYLIKSPNGFNQKTYVAKFTKNDGLESVSPASNIASLDIYSR